MKTPIYLIYKFWKKHLKNAVALLFSGTLLTAIVFVYLMSSRETFARSIFSIYEREGRHDIIIGNSNDEVLNKITEGRSGYNYGYINVLGTMGNAVNSFPYGTINDKHDIYFVPLDEGRMPETADELAIDRGVLKLLFWAGKCGDNITLNDKTYSVVGIINEEFGKYRPGSQLSVDSKDYGNGYYVPLIFIGDSDEIPLYRIDFINNFFGGETEFGLDDRLKDNPGTYYEPILLDLLNEDQWYHYTQIDPIRLSFIRGYEDIDDKLFLYIAYIGAVISVLSVFSVLRSVFAERRGKIDILKKLGAAKTVIAKMYAVECAALALLQTAFGILAGLAAYGAIFLFKTGVLDAKPYSGFADIPIVRGQTHDPFLYAIIISAALFVTAYLITVFTANVRPKQRIKNKRPRSLSHCFRKVFVQGSVTVVQTVALMLICFSVMMGYLYYTDDGKNLAAAQETGYFPYIANYKVGNPEDGEIDMAENNVAEYYFCSPPSISGTGHMDNPSTKFFYTLIPGYTQGIDDNTVSALPENAYTTGIMKNTFIVSDKPNTGYGSEIDLSNEIIREGLISTSSEKNKNFFGEGEIGSKHMYQSPTKLVSTSVLNRLSDYVEDGEINVVLLNEGKELLVVYQSKKPSFNVGEKVTVYSATAGDENVGISDIVSAEVTVGAIVKIPQSAGDLLNYTVRDEREGHSYNFLTTAAGAEAMGLPCAKYTEVFTEDKIDGGIFPLSAEMKLTSLEKLKRENFIKRAAQYGGIALVLVVMSLLGFSAYFNGIGMKIRMRSYEISVMRAVGTPVSMIRKKLALASAKIPLIASALSYGLIKLMQLIMHNAYDWYIKTMGQVQKMSGEIYNKWQSIVLADPERYLTADGAGDLLYKEMSAEVDAITDKAKVVMDDLLFNKVMWQPSAEIPTLILTVMLCIATYILTALTLRKFQRDIANDLNAGRTRQ